MTCHIAQAAWHNAGYQGMGGRAPCDRAVEEITTPANPRSSNHLGDYDPSGHDAARKIEETLRELAPDAEIHLERLAVTPQQIEHLELPTRSTKATDSRAEGFGAEIVELDSIPPNALRAFVRVAIERHLRQQQLELLKVAEESERPSPRLSTSG